VSAAVRADVARAATVSSSSIRTSPMSTLPLFQILLEASPQELADFRRRLRRKRRPVRLALEDLRARVRDRLALEDLPAGEALEQHTPERPDVRAPVHDFAGRLLGAHVRRRPENRPGECPPHAQCRRHRHRRGSGLGLEQPGEAEVEHFHFKGGNENRVSSGTTGLLDMAQGTRENVMA
jgi:hypothetical protein